MNNVFTLTKILIKSSGEIFPQKNKNAKNRSNKITFLWLVPLLVFSAIMIIVPFFFMAYAVAKGTSEIGMQNILLVMAVPTITILILILSAFLVISFFYLSVDNSLLLPLPLKPWQIILARLFVCFFYIYIIEFLLLAPIFIGYGMGMGASLMFYISIVVLLFLLPVIPVMIVLLLTSFFMRFINITKHRDAFTLISSLFIIIISVGFSVLMQSFSSNMEFDPSMIENLKELEILFLNSYSNFMPFIKPAIYSLISDTLPALLNLCLYILINVGSLAIFTVILNKYYFKTILGTGENSSKRVVLSSKKFERATGVKSTFLSYLSKEWKMIYRSPTYLLNFVIVIFIMPIMFVVVFAFSGEAFDIALLVQELGLSNFRTSTVFLIVFTILMFFNSMSMASSTAISREGINAWFMKTIPVSPMKQINAKVAIGTFLSFLTIVIMTIFISTIGLGDWLDVLLLNVAILPWVLGLNYLGILLDLAKPKLEWTNEAAAAKNNMNSFYYLLIDLAVTFVFVGITIGLYALNNISIEIPFLVVFIALFLLGCLLCSGLVRIIKNKKEKIFDSIS